MYSKLLNLKDKTGRLKEHVALPPTFPTLICYLADFNTNDKLQIWSLCRNSVLIITFAAYLQIV
jgi:hypothetical protein